MPSTTVLRHQSVPHTNRGKPQTEVLLIWRSLLVRCCAQTHRSMEAQAGSIYWTLGRHPTPAAVATRTLTRRRRGTLFRRCRATPPPSPVRSLATSSGERSALDSRRRHPLSEVCNLPIAFRSCRGPMLNLFECRMPVPNSSRPLGGQAPGVLGGHREVRADGRRLGDVPARC